MDLFINLISAIVLLFFVRRKQIYLFHPCNKIGRWIYNNKLKSGLPIDVNIEKAIIVFAKEHFELEKLKIERESLERSYETELTALRKASKDAKASANSNSNSNSNSNNANSNKKAGKSYFTKPSNDDGNVLNYVGFISSIFGCTVDEFKNLLYDVIGVNLDTKVQTTSAILDNAGATHTDKCNNFNNNFGPDLKALFKICNDIETDMNTMEDSSSKIKSLEKLINNDPNNPAVAQTTKDLEAEKLRFGQFFTKVEAEMVKYKAKKNDIINKTKRTCAADPSRANILKANHDPFGKDLTDFSAMT